MKDLVALYHCSNINRTLVQPRTERCLSRRMASFLFNDERVRKVFMELHSELLQPEFWQAKQATIRAKGYEDVFPYARARRFPTRQRIATHSMARLRKAAS